MLPSLNKATSLIAPLLVTPKSASITCTASAHAPTANTPIPTSTSCPASNVPPLPLQVLQSDAPPFLKQVALQTVAEVEVAVLLAVAVDVLAVEVVVQAAVDVLQ